MKRIAILGATGSIGKSVCAIADQFPDEFRITAISANTNIDSLRALITKYRPASVAILDETESVKLQGEHTGNMKVFSGSKGIMELINLPDVDIVINALVGFAGVAPTIRAIECGKTIALANKESLVVAGEIIMELARRKNVRILPIDSEHNAIWQCLVGEEASGVRRIILTASGGPFLYASNAAVENATVDEALNHPKWKMGRKISIDSATLMNKGLEVHEARWLFDLPAHKIDVIVHPQSIVHSMVEFADGSIKAQLGVTDMKLPIQYALFYPQRKGNETCRLDLSLMRELTFMPPDKIKFPCLQLAYDALDAGGTAPAILNAANEMAVEAFLNKKIRFGDIPRIVESALAGVHRQPASLESLYAADGETRTFASNIIHNAIAA